jgi:hypothetical protein
MSQQDYPKVGDLVWVSLNISELCEPADENEKQILDWDGQTVLGYVKSYTVDEDTIDSDNPDIWVCIHVLDNQNVPYQYEYFYNFTKYDDDSIQRPLTEFEVSWHTHNAEF